MFMVCPVCGGGYVYHSKVIMKNGKSEFFFGCGGAECSWADEMCREKEMYYPDFYKQECGNIDHTEHLGKVNFEVSHDDYYAWETKEITDMICPYCRTPNLLHGITKQTKREIYECSECDTIWIGSVDPAHVSNFRKYKSDGIRVPDAAEIDIAGVKYPAMENEKQTDFVCPKCKGNVIFGRIRTTDIDVLHCKRCNSVWLNSVCPENEINYREYLTSKEI